MNSITVLGMDPSMRNWGYCLATIDLKTLKVTVEKIWTQRTEKGSAKKKVRVSSDDLETARALAEALEEATAKAQIAFVEVPHGSQSASGMKSYGMCLGVLAQCRLPMVQLTENDLKTRSVGKRTATKRDMIEWAAEKNPEANWPMRKGEVQANAEHMADATIAIHAGIQDEQFRSALAIIRHLQKARA